MFSLFQCLGPHNIVATPIKQILATILSYKSGVFLLIHNPHKTERTINTPPKDA